MLYLDGMMSLLQLLDQVHLLQLEVSKGVVEAAHLLGPFLRHALQLSHCSGQAVALASALDALCV